MKKIQANEISIIIPCFNDSANVQILIKKLKKIFLNLTIIVVDDSSKSENKKIKNFLKGKKDIILISRLKKLGRGSAVLRGFSEALKDKNKLFFVEMDSDLAHSPKEIIRFINKNKDKRYNLIIGSRYIAGGRSNIEKKRVLLSKVINTFLRFWLGIKISDFTSGFRLYSRDAVTFVTKANLKASGFIALSEIAYVLSKNGFKIGEVPITVYERKYGKSTLNFKELFTSLIFVVKLRIKY